MSDLDETDMEILRLLVADGRRPFADIGDAVGLSGPAVSNRVSRLRESGVIEGFTAVVDRSTLTSGPGYVVRLSVTPGETKAVFDDLRTADGVQHCYRTAGATLIAHVTPGTADVEGWLDGAVDFERVTGYSVDPLVESETPRGFSGTEFALSCAECGNTVTEEGTAERLGERRYHFCCPSCAEKFREHYESVASGV